MKQTKKKSIMTSREVLEKVLDRLSEEQLRQVLDFAMFLHWKEEEQLWQRFSLEQLAQAYGEDEPDYSDLLTPKKPSRESRS